MYIYFEWHIPALIIAKWKPQEGYTVKNCFCRTHQTPMAHEKTGILVTFGNQDTLITNLLG